MSNSYNFSNRKLTDAQADEIRRRYVRLKVTQKQLAKEYNVAEGCIQRIIENKSYKQPNPQKAS